MTAYQFAVNMEISLNNPDDPLLNSYDRSVFIPDFSFGASFTTSRYYVGFAMTNLLRGSLLIADTSKNKQLNLQLLSDRRYQVSIIIGLDY